MLATLLWQANLRSLSKQKIPCMSPTARKTKSKGMAIFSPVAMITLRGVILGNHAA